MTAVDLLDLPDLEPGGHVCWVVANPETYITGAAALLEGAAQAGQEPVIFGPAGSTALLELAPLAADAVDPGDAALGRGPLDSQAMLTLFRERSALARDNGHRGLRVVADMDWLLPAQPTTDGIIELEVLLGPLAWELDATLVCAYRQASYDAAVIAEQLCVHPTGVGGDRPPQFRLVADAEATWGLSGEIDIAVAAVFQAALTHALGGRDFVVDVSGLEFIDVAGMRVIATASTAGERTIRLVGARRSLRRAWDLAGFGNLASGVELTS